jgi:hypothetical protein
VLGASPFEVKSYGAVKDNEKAAARLLPSLILDQFSSGYIRTIPPTEAENRSLKALRTAQQSLFLELSGEIKKRDVIVLDNRNPRTIKKKIAEAEKIIAGIKQKIDDNQKEIQKLLPGFDSAALDDTKKEFFLIRLFRKKKPVNQDAPITEEAVSIWKEDEHSLFTANKDSRGNLLTGAALEKALGDAKINGYITGTIMVQDEFAAVQVELRVYPGGELLGTALEIGRITDTALLSRSLIYALLPHIVHNIPAFLQFEVYPEEIRETIHIAVDDTVLLEIPEAFPVQSGIHDISFDAPGYTGENLSISLDGGQTYRVRVELTSKILEAITLALKNEAAGMFLVNAAPLGPSPVPVEITGQQALGRFDGEEGHAGYFTIPDAASKSPPGTTWIVNPNTTDISAKIELSRKIMYASYSAFMVSLPVTFYCLGEYTQHRNGWALRQVEQSELNRWESYQNLAIGTSVALFGNFLVQLFVYLYRANAIIPVNAVAPKPARR